MTNLLSVGTVSSRYSAPQIAMRRQEVKKEVRYDSGPESKRKEGVLKGTMLGVPMTIQFGLRLDQRS